MPDDITCTQVLQKWHAPSKKLPSNVAVKFSALQFEKANQERDKSKKRKRPIVSGNRGDYCATPTFAKSVAKQEIQALSEALEKAGRATLLAKTLRDNHFQPCSLFKTSCNNIGDLTEVPIAKASGSTTCDIFQNMSTDMEACYFDDDAAKLVLATVGVTLQESRAIEKETQGQGNCQAWFYERSKRLTSSLFGRIVRRKEHIYPKSILEQIKRCKDGKEIQAQHCSGGLIMRKLHS